MTAADIALDDFDKGWRPFEMPPEVKYPPPTGITGYKGRNLERSALAKIADGSNLALRMPPDVIGLDVDAYHDGDVTIAELEDKHGALPPTCMTHSNRGDGSGIRFYRIPPGTMLVTSLPGVELIQWFHRYAMVAPSVHPEGRHYAWATAPTLSPASRRAVIASSSDRGGTTGTIGHPTVRTSGLPALVSSTHCYRRDDDVPRT